MEFTHQNNPCNSLETPRSSQVDVNSTTQSTSNPNKINVNSTTTDDTLTKEVMKVNVEVEQDPDTRRDEGSTNINDPRITNEQESRNAGGAKGKRLTCEFCRKEFNHAGDLKKHRRTHTGEQPYACNRCQQRFSHASNLVRHRRMHSGERPFSCRMCGSTFTRKDKLTAHVTMKRCHTKH